MMRLEYDFRIGGSTVGTFVLTDDPSEIRQVVDFVTEDTGRYRNEHLVRHRGGRPIAYRVGTGAWIDCADAPADHWPTASWPLLLQARVTEYVAIDEESGETSRRTLEYTEGRVEECQAGRVVRAFDLRDGHVVRIDWGGAISEFQ